ncbi:MAG: ATP-binding cassette domain-containing protein, partial [Chlorobi bacterium]|nr:ATP-binding cassette domain-containing protein [Chlorobiota bacterium]
MNIEGLSKVYLDSTGHIVHLLENVDLSFGEGEFTTILAPTGSGKSALLKIISGLETSSSGKIEESTKKKIFIP